MGLALAGCSSPTDAALTDARQTCTSLGYGGDSKSTATSATSDPSTWDAVKWAELAESTDERADQAARAAREDPRWDRLSNAVTDFHKLTELRGTIENPEVPLADRNAAQAQYDAMNSPGVVRSLEQECRKALAD
ncbi:hypothetical protein [Streptomyces sp. NPDC057250]|uniref:hypothetical protein n=1 Tax=Streptomyces sp. NPDC057250 TaxID=3346068 RepID=UPI00362811FD